MSRLATLAAVGTAALCYTSAPGLAASGSIDFKTLNVSLSSKDGRPVEPVITAVGNGANWSVSGAPVVFNLRIYASVNTFSSITRVRVGAPSVNSADAWHAWVAGYAEGAQKLEIKSTQRSIPGDRMGLVGLSAAQACRQAQAAGGRTGNFDLPFRFDVEVEVMATRGIVNIENRTKVFQRSVMGIVRCIVTAGATAEPQRTPGAPKRTPGAPKRTAPAYEAISAELGIARARNTWQCPLEVRVSMRVVAKGPGVAKVYIVKQDGKGTISQPYYVKVDRQVGGTWVGVHQHTIKVLNPINEKYRIVVAGQDGKPAVEAAWVPLEVSCKPTAGNKSKTGA